MRLGSWAILRPSAFKFVGIDSVRLIAKTLCHIASSRLRAYANDAEGGIVRIQIISSWDRASREQLPSALGIRQCRQLIQKELLFSQSCCCMVSNERMRPDWRPQQEYAVRTPRAFLAAKFGYARKRDPTFVPDFGFPLWTSMPASLNLCASVS